MIHLIDGKKVAQQKQEEIKVQTAQLKKEGITPGLAVVLVGDELGFTGLCPQQRESLPGDRLLFQSL